MSSVLIAQSLCFLQSCSARRLSQESSDSDGLIRQRRLGHNEGMIKIIWLLATVYFMSRLVKKLMSSMKEINREEDLDAGDAVVDVEAE